MTKEDFRIKIRILENLDKDHDCNQLPHYSRSLAGVTSPTEVEGDRGAGTPE